MCECDRGYSEQRTSQESLSSKAKTTWREDFPRIDGDFSFIFLYFVSARLSTKINLQLELVDFMHTRSLLRIFFQN